MWLEITTLLIPGVNDDETQLKGLVELTRKSLGWRRRGTSVATFRITIQRANHTVSEHRESD